MGQRNIAFDLLEPFYGEALIAWPRWRPRRKRNLADGFLQRKAVGFDELQREVIDERSVRVLGEDSGESRGHGDELACGTRKTGAHPAEDGCTFIVILRKADVETRTRGDSARARVRPIHCSLRAERVNAPCWREPVRVF